MSKKIILVGSILGAVILIALFFALSEPTSINDNNSTESSVSQQALESTVPEETTELTVVSYTAQEVAIHNSNSDCWTIIDDFVYDITKFIAEHPGGEVIATICGTDGTEEFSNQGVPSEEANKFRQENDMPQDSKFHSPNAQSILKSYELGPLKSVRGQM